MFRWCAIRGEPLAAYFTIEEIPVKELGAFQANMYLAEDRILCFEIVGRASRRWLLKYVSTAFADTDTPVSGEPMSMGVGPTPSPQTHPRRFPPRPGPAVLVQETLLGLMKQRRRWFNGSFFALLYYLK